MSTFPLDEPLKTNSNDSSQIITTSVGKLDISFRDEPSVNRPASSSTLKPFDYIEANDLFQTYISKLEKPYLRWVTLFFASLLVFGNDYCYDLPQALQTQVESTLNINEIQYSLLYSVYSIPNVFLPLAGGFLIDYFGIRICVLLYMILIVLGQLFYTAGSYSESFALMLVGRVVIGAGSESLNVAQAAIVNKWFKGRELTTALGISLCVCRLGSALNSFITPKVYAAYGSLGLCAFVGLMFVAFSTICGLIILFLDRNYRKEDPTDESDKVSIREVATFNASFWLLLANAVICFQSFFAFLNVANQYMQVRFQFTENQAGNLLTIPYVTSAILTPILSIAVDKFGHKAKLMIVTTLLLLGIHISFFLIPDCTRCFFSLIPLVLLGIFFAMHTSLLIPSVSVIVLHRVLGTAIGFITSGQNLGLAVGPLFVGTILSDEQADGSLLTGFTDMTVFLGTLALSAVLLAVVNYWYDAKFNHGVLEKRMVDLNKHLSRMESIGEENRRNTRLNSMRAAAL